VKPISHFFVRCEPFQASFILELEKNWSHEKHAHQMNPKKGLDMRADRIAVAFAIVTVFGVAVQTPAFSQDHQGTMEQQMACTPDVFRLCGEQIPDSNRIVACLRQNASQLSRPCRAVFDSNASMQPQAAPRSRDSRSWPGDDR
jgi:hypothetical protein